MKNIMSDMVNQWWTLLGMFIAWVVLEGSAKTVVGYSIIASLGVWGLTYRLRNPKDKDENI